jgi:hypothetical protein
MDTMTKEEKCVVYMGAEENALRVQALPGDLEPVEVGYSETDLGSKASFRESHSCGLGVCACVGADLRTLYLTGAP